MARNWRAYCDYFIDWVFGISDENPSEEIIYPESRGEWFSPTSDETLYRMEEGRGIASDPKIVGTPNSDTNAVIFDDDRSEGAITHGSRLPIDSIESLEF